MIPEIGQFALILAFCFALIQAIFPLLGSYRNEIFCMQLARPTALGQLVFVLISVACLIYAFITNDFSVQYVAQNSNTELPLPYKIAALWGAHEGSVLLWIMILSLWTNAVAWWSRIPELLIARVLSILGILSAGFLLFSLTTSNPFQRLLPNAPLQGADLNPLLQDPGLAIHPPMLYMGYVGFAVAFAFAIAALLNGRLDTAWARWTRPWTIAAWSFLTAGITLGSWWAYRELGWGGWWFWDPVENASFLPWLTGTALMHSLIVVEKRGSFKSWTVLLAICAFSLSLIGTFLVRSGVLVSVHAFASDPTRGAFLLQFLAAVIGASLLLYAVRAPTIRGGSYFALLSRETFLLINNVLLIIIMATLLLGTLYPLILDALNLGKISVGPPYFNAVFVPLMIPLLILMGAGPLSYWREMNGAMLVKRLWLPLICAILLGVILIYVSTGQLPWQVALGVILASWIILATLQLLLSQIIHKKNFSFVRHILGMTLAHLGIAICVIGITLTSYYKIERDVKITIGDTAKVGPYDFHFMEVNNLQGPNYQGIDAVFAISQGDKPVSTLHAQKRIYNAQQIVMTEAAIDAGIFRDLYIALGEPLTDSTWSVRIYYKPFVRWIWFGGILMVLGGIAAISQRNKRRG